MTDPNVTELRPSPHMGEGVTGLRSRAAKPDRTNAARQRRFKQKRKLAPGNAIAAATASAGNQNIKSPQDVATVASLPQVTAQGNAIAATLQGAPAGSRQR